MTEAELRTAVAYWLCSYEGCTEGGAKHRELLSIFNNSGLCSRYKMQVSDPWCAAAVSAAFIALGLAGEQGSGALYQCVECYCDSVIAKAKQQGIWVEDDAYVPMIGDVILYDWQDSGYGDNVGVSDHIGIVCSVSGSTIKVIEGNISDSVGYRSIQVNGRYIRGYVTPNYAKFAESSGNATTITETSTWQLWTNGSTSEPLYKDNAFSMQIETIPPYTKCNCIGFTSDHFPIVLYHSGGDTIAVGYVEYDGGVAFVG